MQELYKAKTRLERAISKNRSKKWCLTLWGEFIKLRDGSRCLICGANSSIQAHHIFRKTTISIGIYEIGNGITLCRLCHAKVHADFNGRSDLSKPLGSEGGDDQDEAAFLYGLLCDDARERGIDEQEFYFISDAMSLLFVRFQGYENLFESMISGKISRIRFAHEIWSTMPEIFYEKLAESLFAEFI